MKKKFRQLYIEMQEDLKMGGKEAANELESVTESFWIAAGYWEKLKVIMLPFESDREEIDFFKKVKPAFTCYMEFYTLLSEALVYAGKLAAAELPSFWEQEAARYNYFYQRHCDFIDYIEKDNHQLDSRYFLRRTARASENFKGLFDTEPGFSASQEYRVRTYRARLKYFNYCTAKLAQLNQQL